MNLCTHVLDIGNSADHNRESGGTLTTDTSTCSFVIDQKTDVGTA